VPVSGVKDAAYYYSTYHPANAKSMPAPAATANPKKVLILGGGPNRIGQGIEFDYCCVHAAFALRAAGYETIMVNCNPETVSTDYDTSDKLYFEPLTIEDVLQIHAKEKPMGVVVQFGGQTPLNIARELAANGVRILGTSIDSIDDAEDRDLFRQKMERLGIPMPESGMASTFAEAKAVADKIGYPIMIRPSFILGGRGMEVIYDEDMLREYVARAIDVTPERPLLLDRFLQNALECEADALADGKDVFIPAVMEHVELAGVHSGDSACVLPPVSITPAQLETINDYTRKIAQELKVVGLMNMQYAIEDGKVYVLEANPRASRTVPLVSKVCNVQMARIATQLMLGASIPSMKLTHQKIPHYGVKESVMPFDKFPEVDPILGPEMRSTGEVLGMSAEFGLAYCKAQEAAQSPLPAGGTALLSVWERTPQVLEIARSLAASNFKLRATVGTRAFLAENGIVADLAIKIGEGRPDIPDDIKNGQVQLIINSPISKRASQTDDSYIRKAAIKHRIPYMTTLAAASAAAKGIAAKLKNPTRPIYSLQEYHAQIK
jgi:carbamoyl-phosphate synthase large subunit